MVTCWSHPGRIRGSDKPLGRDLGRLRRPPLVTKRRAMAAFQPSRSSYEKTVGPSASASANKENPPCAVRREYAGRMRFVAAFAAALALLGVGIAVARHHSKPAKPPIVLVVFDALPESMLMKPGGQIDAERFPAFADLAADSTWYRNAT